MKNPDWVLSLREQFPAAKRTVFLDIAYENCGSTFAHKAVDQFFSDWLDVSPDIIKASGEGKGKIYQVIQQTRHSIAELLGGVDANHVAFTKNTNEGINAILQGFPWEPGGNIVTDDQEHPSVIMPCLNLQNKGIECRVVIAEDGVSVTPELLFSKVDQNTRFIVVSHVQSGSGYKIDLPKLASKCHINGIFLIVDAIQSLGFCEVNANHWGLDAVSAACYKGLLGLSGSGFLYCSPQLLDKITPVYAAMNPAVSVVKEPWKLQYSGEVDAHKLENSTINFMGVYALNAGIEQIQKIGIQNVQQHISGLYEMLYRGLAELGFSIATPFESESRCHSLSILTKNPQSLYQYFMQNGIFLSLSAGKYVRISIAPFTTHEDISSVLLVAKNWCLESKKAI